VSGLVRIVQKISLSRNTLKSQLFTQLRELGIGACGTTRKDVVSPLFGDSFDTWKPEWGTLWSKIYGPLENTDKTTLISAWQDSAIVKFAATIHTGKE